MSNVVRYGQVFAIGTFLYLSLNPVLLGLTTLEKNSSVGKGFIIFLGGLVSASISFLCAIGIYKWNRRGRKWILFWCYFRVLVTALLLPKQFRTDKIGLALLVGVILWLMVPAVRNKFDGILVTA